MVTVVFSGFVACEPAKHRLPGTGSKQPVCAVWVQQLPYKRESVGAENSERNLHENQMFLRNYCYCNEYVAAFFFFFFFYIVFASF